ncbi:MAG: hypothetical protein GY856_35010 [bacterium]|nr:hypothetical protein [bacterium]
MNPDHRIDPEPEVSFDPRLEISPYTVWHRLESGPKLLLVDLRRPPGRSPFADVLPWRGPDWRPATDEDVVFFDDDGTEALEVVRRLRAAGHSRARALFGGLALYELALDTVLDGHGER